MSSTANSQERNETYDLKELNRLANGNKEFLAKMIRTFIKSSTEMYTQMKESLSSGDWTRIRNAAHKAIPSFSFMGLKDYAGKLKFIETNATQIGERRQVKELTEFICSHITPVLRDLDQELIAIEHK